MADNIQKAIDSGVRAIRVAQQPNGGFLSMASGDPEDFSGATIRATTFFAANILNLLNSLPNADDIKARCVQFLLEEKTARWSFNYWARGAKERETLPYPDDLDDTFVALHALMENGMHTIDGSVLGIITQLLTMLEVEEGGPYRTWLVSADSNEEWLDVDVAVNANIRRFLASLDVTLPKLDAFLADRISSGLITSPYYPDEYPVLYFIASSYRRDAPPALRKKVSSLYHGAAGKRNQLQSAFIISALLFLGEDSAVVRSEVEALANHIERDGWRPYPFCIDPMSNGKRQYAGAAALTAAFCAEALSAYVKSVPKKDMPPPDGAEANIAAIKKIAQEMIEMAPSWLRAIALEQLAITNDPKITLLPYGIQSALGPAGAKIKKDFLEQLALANLCGWMAYTVYDDFLDGEGDARSLSTANFFLRDLTARYHGLEAAAPGIRGIYEKIMNCIDDANAWEQANCRVKIGDGCFIAPKELPYASLENLAHRSLGHALPAIAILLYQGYAPDSEAVQRTESLFRHYLIARQLHDDAHDWGEDLVRGQINSVGARLINAGENIDIVAALPVLQKIFWHEVIDGVADDIFFHIAMAHSDLARLKTVFPSPSFFEELLDGLKDAAKNAIKERDDAVLFLKEYNGEQA